MKRIFGFQLKSTALCFALAGATAFAADNATVDSKAISKTLSSVPAPELAATAAKLVQDAPAKQVEDTTRQVVRSAVAQSPAASVAVVGSISRQNQQMAPVAAGTAAVLAPKQAVAIAKAAATAAPAQSAKIVQAICEAAPKQYREIALAVSRIAPDQSKAIFEALATALPQLKDRIAQVQNHFSDITVSTLPTMLLEIEHPTFASATTDSTITKASPTVGPPFQTPVTTPTVLTPASSGNAGGERYETPAP